MSLLTAVVALFRKVKAENPVRLLSAVLGVLVAIVGFITPYVDLLKHANVQTWQAALPVLAGELLRRYVFAPNTVTNLLALQAAALKASPKLAPVATAVDAVILPLVPPVAPVQPVAAVPVPITPVEPPVPAEAPPAAA